MDQDASNSETGLQGEEGFREQDRFLPISNVYRIMRKAVPENAKISKEAKELVQECVSEFISFITSEASDRCIQARRKTITGDDILASMELLGFDNYIVPLTIYMNKFRELNSKNKNRQPMPPPLGHALHAAPLPRSALHGDMDLNVDQNPQQTHAAYLESVGALQAAHLDPRAGQQASSQQQDFVSAMFVGMQGNGQNTS